MIADRGGSGYTGPLPYETPPENVLRLKEYVGRQGALR
jgi:hypothetical protein